jgi:chemotaxis protein methyltransferase CheR
MQVTAEDIKVISRLVSDLCGIVLDETKGYLIQSRLSTLAEEAGCKTFSELYYKARYDRDATLRNKVIDAITTNETLFFRDTSPFDVLQNKVLPDLFDARAKSAFPKRIRIWSAACSTGQEPYSMAMTFYELLGDLTGWDIQILATDISDAAIRHASIGRYAVHEIRRGMRPDLLKKYFIEEPQGWRIQDRLRALVAFKRLNLLEPFTALGMFDVIFCRNVAIYFAPQARKDLFLRLAAQLPMDGSLMVGSSESLTDLGERFKPHNHCRAIFYRPNLRPTSIAPPAPAPPKFATAGAR